MKYSIILPCRNEAKTVGICIRKAQKALPGCEIIVVDNNSTDSSAKIASKSGAIVILEKNQGYGSALLAGFKKARGEYIIMCDSDDTYNLEELSNFTKYHGYDIVIGNRFNRKMQKGSMTFLHRYIGNPLLSLILRIFFKSNVTDNHCGFRMIKASALEKLQLFSPGMEIASEMMFKAARLKLKVKEIPISYNKRKGISKLNSFKDGWRHLSLMLLYSPDYLYLVPGIASLIIGLTTMITLFITPIYAFGITFYVHPMFIASLLLIAGYQIIILWLFSKYYWKDKQSKFYNSFSLEKGLIAGATLFILGLALNLIILTSWIKSNYAQLYDIKNSIVGLTLMLLGLQTFFSSFYISILMMKK